MEHLVWDVSPEIFRIGAFSPRYYGLLFACGFLVGYHFMRKIFLAEGKNEEHLSSLLFHIMLGTIIGARLGHCLFYEPAYYLSNPIEILKVWRGGLASHGGGIGVLIAVWLYKRQHADQPYLWLADRLAVGVAFTGACIRIGNFFNSEILGRQSDVPWAIVFARVDEVPRHPAMLYESLAYFILFGLLWLMYKKKGTDLAPGRMLGLFLIWIFTARFGIEFFKENQVAFEGQMFLNMGQLLSIPFILAGLAFFTGLYKKWLPQLAYNNEPIDSKGPNANSGKNAGAKKRKNRKGR